MGGGDSGPEVVQQSKSDTAPWAAQQPYLEKGFKGAEGILDNPLQYFPGSTVVPFSGQTEQALQGTEARATAGSPLNAAAQNQALQTLQGQYLDGPGSSAVYDAVESQVRPGIDSQFSGAGRYGSGLHSQAAAQGMARGLAPYEYQRYQNERGMQQNAMTAAPGLAQTDYADLGALAGVGASREGQSAQQLQDEMARYNFAQDEPTARLNRYMGLIGGNYGGQTTSTMTRPGQSSNPLMMGLGAASFGLGAANTLFNPFSGMFPNTF